MLSRTNAGGPWGKKEGKLDDRPEQYTNSESHQASFYDTPWGRGEVLPPTKPGKSSLRATHLGPPHAALLQRPLAPPQEVQVARHEAGEIPLDTVIQRLPELSHLWGGCSMGSVGVQYGKALHRTGPVAILILTLL